MQEVNSRCKEYHLPSNFNDNHRAGGTQETPRWKGSVLYATVQLALLRSKMWMNCPDFVAMESALTIVPVEQFEHLLGICHDLKSQGQERMVRMHG